MATYLKDIRGLNVDPANYAYSHVPSEDLRDIIPFIFITDEPVARGYGDGYMVRYVIVDRSPK